MKCLFLLLPFVFLPACTTQEIQRTLNSVLNSTQELSPAEVASGLKQALEFGIAEGARRLSQEDGYFKSPYKIMLPAEARRVTDRLQGIPGFGDVEHIVLEKINRGAEEAAKRAEPIFVNAIKQMTFNDAMGILMGEENAATSYLRLATEQQLYTEFKPVIIESLDKFNARKYWSDAVNTYNKVPLVDKVDPNLDEYVTNEALKGLFSMVEKKEIEIRKNISARTTDLLRKVFARQDNK